jgi:3-hydroxyisobutyrate dehydrogenase-like beta-hydroxyacid dehydrogenase
MVCAPAGSLVGQSAKLSIVCSACLVVSQVPQRAPLERRAHRARWRRIIVTDSTHMDSSGVLNNTSCLQAYGIAMMDGPVMGQAMPYSKV